jgi:hypothetical protein
MYAPRATSKKVFQNQKAWLSAAGSWMPWAMRAVRRAGGPAIRAHRSHPPRRETVRSARLLSERPSKVAAVPERTPIPGDALRR